MNPYALLPWLAVHMYCLHPGGRPRRTPSLRVHITIGVSDSSAHFTASDAV